MKPKNNHSNRGSIMLFTLILLSVMMSIVLTFAGSYITQLRVSTQASNAMISLFAADSAVELCLFELRRNEDATLAFIDPLTSFELRDIETEDLITNCADFLGITDFSFRAQGLRSGVGRALEISI